MVDTRTAEATDELVADLRRRTGERCSWRITSDECPAYAEAIRTAYGREVMPPSNRPAGRPAGRNHSDEAYQSIFVQDILINTIPIRQSRLFAAACGRHVARHFPEGSERQKWVLDVIRVVSECAGASTGRKRLVDAVQTTLPRILPLGPELDPEVDEAIDDWSTEAVTGEGKRRKVSEGTTRRANVLSQQAMSLDVIWYAARSQVVPPSQVVPMCRE